ncbi:3-oxoacyl-ACP synthase [Streptomyces albus subsp. albus]|nr:3-oxoacyl-ACP synthase [Streptomyces albus subsp. albus]
MTERWPITGVGAVASVGRNAGEIFESLCAARSGLAPMREFTKDWYTAGELYEIQDDTKDAAGRPSTAQRATGFLLDAVAQALADAGMDEDLGDIPVLVGTGLRELRSVERWWRDGDPLTAAGLHFGAALRERFNASNTHTFSNACSASLYALSLATDLLADEAGPEAVVVAGTDSITESMFGIADRVQSVPPGAVRPFDRNRMGTILGEGAAAVVLRRAPRDGEAPRGWVRAVGVNCDAIHATAPDAGMIAEVMRETHRRAEVAPADIDLVMLHGTGTPANDLGEALAMGEVFGEDVRSPVMTAMKSMTGHTSGGSGLHALITALASMRTGRIAPTISLDDPMDEVEKFRIVRDREISAEVSLAQINAFGFGGINAVAIVEAAS